jgi:hypothetical protein
MYQLVKNRQGVLMGNVMGSLEWGAVDQGRMSLMEKGQICINLLLARSEDVMEAALLHGGLLKQPDIELDSLMPRPGALVEDALDLAQRTHSLPLLRHSWRTYWFSALIGTQQKIRYDPSLLFAAAILHDIGLTEGHHPAPCECCFAVSGGQRAHNYLMEKGHPPALTYRVGDAIARHLNIRLSRYQNHPETYLLSRGALCDLVGLGRHRIATRLRAEVIRQFPRDGVEDALKLSPTTHCTGSRGRFISILTSGRLPHDPLNVDP